MGIPGKSKSTHLECETVVDIKLLNLISQIKCRLVYLEKVIEYTLKKDHTVLNGQMSTI